ncbi:hypothetical protein ACFWUQ_09675 [Streptomyces sp. NPDC058662]|uniref:hypothetical protein n=1 Tax=Streptomyces sp. NPDC058662 TaxID=3346583 RepID=UPI003666F57F
MAALSSCSALPGSGSDPGPGKGDASGPTYQEALEAMLPGVQEAVRQVMPGVEPGELSKGGTNCGGPDFSDGKDASKVRFEYQLDLTGPSSDRRTPQELASGVVTHLTGRGGWEVEQREGSDTPDPSGMVTKYVKKQGSGLVVVRAYPFTTTSGEVVPKLGADILTDCLRNPKY